MAAMLVSTIANSLTGNGPLSKCGFNPYTSDWGTKILLEERFLTIKITPFGVIITQWRQFYFYFEEKYSS